MPGTSNGWHDDIGATSAPHRRHGGPRRAEDQVKHKHTHRGGALAAAEHRTELGGVRLGLGGPDEVRSAAAELLARADAVLVGPQMGGVEVVVGGFRDPSFGPVVMVGLGGIWVEVLADVAFALAPLTVGEARGLLAGLCAPRSPRTPARRTAASNL